MGVNLTPIATRKIVNLEFLRGRTIAFDASIELHQFLALIRTHDGRLLSDDKGEVTSHLVGLAFRTTRLILDYDIRPVFVFDGKPPSLKMIAIEKRREVRRKAEEEYSEAVKHGDYATAFSKAVMTGTLTKSIISDSKRLLDLLGIPYVQAPGEGEAQAAYMAKRGSTWGVGSRDYDSLLFGAPRLVRHITIQGEEYLPSKGISRRIKPEYIELEGFLRHYGLTREQLIDLSILIGTDFNKGVKGIGPKTALKLVKKHGRLEEMPEEILNELKGFEEVRKLYLDPEVTEEYEIKWGSLDEEGLYSFLCDEHSFSKNRVEVIAKRMRSFHSKRTLEGWLPGGG
ncbi:flap endonuclease-1 [Candidatus Bathyarchaeota archaeon]|nr:flap endonuclease-1 [Candidatus Bathyarchaeota archaeon]